MGVGDLSTFKYPDRSSGFSTLAVLGRPRYLRRDQDDFFIKVYWQRDLNTPMLAISFVSTDTSSERGLDYAILHDAFQVAS